MFDVPVDAWYTWLGLAAASVAVFGVAATLPMAPPPDAAGVAGTVDRVASAEYAATAEHPLDADAVRLGRRQIGLRNDAGTAHATFAFGPVTPVPRETALSDVLYGASPGHVYDSDAAFHRALRDARNRTPRWTEADGSLVVRQLRVGGDDVTLVGT
ncbi:MAG: hypothetical protein ABEJ78_04415 [Haloferacaceae archaeon]